jgi:hypothetical protein
MHTTLDAAPCTQHRQHQQCSHCTEAWQRKHMACIHLYADHLGHSTLHTTAAAAARTAQLYRIAAARACPSTVRVHLVARHSGFECNTPSFTRSATTAPQASSMLENYSLSTHLCCKRQADHATASIPLHNRCNTAPNTYDPDSRVLL